MFNSFYLNNLNYDKTTYSDKQMININYKQKAKKYKKAINNSLS